MASHDGARLEAIPITHSSEISAYLSPPLDVVAIDEVQFLDDAIVPIAQQLADQGVRMILAGVRSRLPR